MKLTPTGTATDLLRTLREAREAKQLSQLALGKRLDMAQARISVIETGRADPQLSTLQNLAAALDLQLMLAPRALWPALHALIDDYYTAATLPNRPPVPTERPLYRLPDEDAEETAAPVEDDAPADEAHNEPA